ncbi:MAG: hypothetical protein ACRYGP_23685 [Janthinobacterium lividum]
MSVFKYARSVEQSIVKKKNSPPAVEGVDLEDLNDAFVLQQGHGICKGLASSWVIAFLNRVSEASDAKRFAEWFEIARLHGTEIKNAGGHIDQHIAKIEAANVMTGVNVQSRIDASTVAEAQFPKAPWATYCSIWKHDIAFGADSVSGRFYIMEPNDGLAIYKDRETFLADLKAYIEDRRKVKGKQPNETIGLYYCTQKA